MSSWTPASAHAPALAVRAAGAVLPILLGLLVTGGAGPLGAQNQADAGASAVPALGALVDRPGSELAAVVERFADDRAALLRRHDTPWSADRRARLQAFYGAWRDRLGAMDFDALGVEARIDWVLLDTELEYLRSELEREARLYAEMTPLLPFAS